MPIRNSMVDAFLKALKNIEEKLGVHRQFRLLTFIVLLTVGSLIIYFANGNSRTHVIEHLAESTSVITKTVLDPALLAEDFKWPQTRISKERFDSVIKSKIIKPRNDHKDENNMGHDTIVTIKVWNKSGRVVYDSSGKTTGEVHKKNQDLQESLKGQIESGYTQADSEDRFTAQNMELIEVYTPAKVDGKIMGAYELYLTTDSVIHFTRQSMIANVAVTVLGLLFLYLSLSWLFSRAHRKISKSNKETKKITNKLVVSLKELEENYLGTIQALTMAVDAKDHYTAGHSFRVASLAKEIGITMGFSEEAVNNLERGARFHDIGKIGIVERILNKHGTLTAGEFKIMQQHPVIGAKILGSVNFLKDIIPIVRSHHERLDGSGYPDGLSGDEISLAARIVAVADVFEAMTSDRPNRKALGVENAFKELSDGSSIRYDEEVVTALLRAFRGLSFYNEDKDDFDDENGISNLDEAISETFFPESQDKTSDGKDNGESKAKPDRRGIKKPTNGKKSRDHLRKIK